MRIGRVSSILCQKHQLAFGKVKKLKEVSSESDVKRIPEISNLDYCIDLVRKHDYENFLCTLLIPDAVHRTGIFAIRAFNTEIALIRDQVTQKEIGLGRFIFWRDAIRLLFKARLQDDHTNILKHPIVEQLSKIVMNTEVHQKWFNNLIESREEGLGDLQYQTLEELELYCEKSVTPVLYLILDLLNFKNIVLDHTCSHLGKAIGISNFIRSIPYNSQKRRVFVPRELLIKHNLSQESFIRSVDSEKIQALVFELATQAHWHYEAAKSQEAEIVKLYEKGQLGLNPLPYFLCAQPTNIYLKRLEKCNFNPYESSLIRRYSLLPFHLYYRRFLKRYY